MSSMQSFHVWLFKPVQESEPRAALKHLTRLSPTDMIALKSDLEWTTWTEASA